MSRSSSLESVHELLPDFEESAVGESRVQTIRRLLSGSPIFGGAQQFVKDNAGFLLVVVAEAFFSASVALKKLNDFNCPMSTLQVVMVRTGIASIFSLTYTLWMKIDDLILGPKGVRLLLVFSGVSGFIGLFAIYYSVQYLPLPDATVLTFLSPMCTAVAGALFLKENFRRSQALAGAVSLLGVVLIARPPFLFGMPSGMLDGSSTEVFTSEDKVTSAQRMVAVGVLLLGVLGITGLYIFVRAIGKRAHAFHALTYFSIICVVVSTIGMIVMRIPFVIPSRFNWLALLLLFSTFGFVGQVFLTMGLQREAAGRASMAAYTQIVFATIFQRILFHTIPTWLSIIGTCLILSSALYVAATKEKEESEQSAIGLNADDFDHMEAALQSKTSHADLSLEEDQHDT